MEASDYDWGMLIAIKEISPSSKLLCKYFNKICTHLEKFYCMTPWSWSYISCGRVKRRVHWGGKGCICRFSLSISIWIFLTRSIVAHRTWSLWSCSPRLRFSDFIWGQGKREGKWGISIKLVLGRASIFPFSHFLILSLKSWSINKQRLQTVFDTK